MRMDCDTEIFYLNINNVHVYLLSCLHYCKYIHVFGWKMKPWSLLWIPIIFSKVLQGGDVFFFFLLHDGIDVPASLGRWWAVPLTPVVWHLKGSASAAGLFWMNMLNTLQGVGGVMRQCHSRAEVSLIAHFLLPACCCTRRGCWETNLELQLTLHLPRLAVSPSLWEPPLGCQEWK